MHTLRLLHDTIGPSSVTATGITRWVATLVTTQYGRTAVWVHVQHRQVPAAFKQNRPEKDHQPQCGTRPRSSLAHPGDPRAGDRSSPSIRGGGPGGLPE